MNRLALVVALFAAAVLVGGSVAAGASKRGESLFIGTEPLKGTIRGHRSSLPPEVVRCRNCHDTSERSERGERKGPPPAAAPPVSRSLLLDKVQRRGGPPSSYDVASLCKLLRTGVDPAYIMISRVMPVYDLDDAQCASLWEFLTERSGH
jgi:hypothetical protein